MDVPAATFPIATDRSPDDALLRRAVRGDGGAFATLHSRHASHAHAAARRILGSTPAAEDAVQEALIQLWRGGERYSADRGSLRSWLIVLVRSRALDLLRRENVRAAAAERAQERGDEPLFVLDAEHVVRRELRGELVASLRSLPNDQREVLALQYLGGRTQAEVSTELDVPLGTVKGRSRLGLARMRRDLEAAA
jgi:RNA polymerase sigma-70 factor (ECF subfamily)